jgi:plasmid segregation protein ParM
MSNENAFQLVAVDDGYARTKLYTVDADGKAVKHALRSSVRTGRYGVGSITGDGFIGLYDTEDGPFTVSEKIEGENTQFDGFHVSTVNRVLVNHTIIDAGFGGRDVDLITGLPVADYFVNGARDVRKIEMKRDNLLKPVTAGTDGVLMPSIKNVTVGCQAVAAWVDFAMDDDLNLRDDIDGAIAIVDIGGRTTDIATVINGESVDHARSGTDNTGVLDVYNAVMHAVVGKFNIRDKLPVAAIDQAIRSDDRSIRLWGKKHDISEIIESALAEHESKLARIIDRIIGDGASINKVVFVGGGSALFTKLKDLFPHNGETVDDPEFANARGLHKYARYQALNN